jgi:hypothetical protein
MMLADPGFVKAKPIEPLHQFQIALDTRGRIFVHRVKRRQEHAVTKRDTWHGVSPGRTSRSRDVIRVQQIANPDGNHEPIA